MVFKQSSMMAIRRRIKLSDASISMRGFLEEIKKYPQLMSRQHYMNLYTGQPEFAVQIGKNDFDRVAGAGGDHIPVADVEKQIADLSVSAERIEAFADKRVVHLIGRSPSRPLPTFDDLTAAIKVLENLVILNWRLLKGANMTTLLPAIILDWQDVFRFP